MPFIRIRCSSLPMVVASLLLATPGIARALCCDQPGSATMSAAEMNTNLICPLGTSTCVMAAQTIDGSATCQVSGCDLDFGQRQVVFDGPFTLASGTLAVHAKTITINKPIAANGALGVDLATTGRECTNGVGDLVIRQAVDVSAANAGFIRLFSGCRIDLRDSGQLLANSSAGAGGTIDLRATTTISQTAALHATASGNDGGTISLTAGDDVLVGRSIDVRSQGDGEGGSITLHAGDHTLAGAVAGGALTVDADLIADGSPDGDGETGEDGGAITLEASGPLLVTSLATIRANGGAPDGSGGMLTLSTQQPPAGVLTPLDGDVTLRGPVILRGATRGDGGDLTGAIGNTFQLSGSLDLSGGGDDASAGSMFVSTGGDLRLDGAIAASGRVAQASGGDVEARAGMASATATLTVARTIDVSAGAGSPAGSVRLAACQLSVQPNVLIDARSTFPVIQPAITLAASKTMTLGTSSRYLAPPTSGTLLVRAPATDVMIASNVNFAPAAVTTLAPAEQTPFPPCPRCGDGVRQAGEPCDPGSGADGACCSSDCLSLICATPTPSATPTTPATGSTSAATPTTTPSPTVTTTPGLPPLPPRAALRCAHTIATGTRRLVTTELVFLEACSLDALACLAVADGEPSRCLARATRRCQNRFAKVLRTHQTFSTAFTRACAGDPPALPFALVRAVEGLGFKTLDETCAADVGLALTSPSAVRACVEHATCDGERALAIAFPALPDLLPQVLTAGRFGHCLPSPSTVGVPELRLSRAALRCQRAIVAGSRTLLATQLAVAQRCAHSLLACRLAGGDPSSCAPIADHCARQLAALADATEGTRARLAARLRRDCGGVPPDALVIPTGLGFGNVATACLGLGEPAPTNANTLAPCLGAAYGCAAGAVLRRAVPLIDSELGRVGIELGADFTCPVASPSPTPSPEASTPTPTSTATPTATPTAAPVTVLIPGGGSDTTDCVAEWTLAASTVNPPPTTSASCTDGDPACDHDGLANGVCVFEVGVCLGGTDPRLPDCPAAAGITSYALGSPSPSTPNAIDAGNAAELIAVLRDLLGSTPGGARQDRFTFSPPRVLMPPEHCTSPARITVELLPGQIQHSKRLRTRTIAAAAGGGNGSDDRDTLLLTCLAPS